MAARALIGLQWGDEGKGKMVDVLSADADLVVRCQGGSNAGHTVRVGDETTALHLVPSGILSATSRCLVGHGTVIDPEQLLREMDMLASRGVRLAGRLMVSENAHVVFPFHKLLDSAQESARAGAAIGTTGKGIGPCYEDKVARCGIRVRDLLEPSRLRSLLERSLVAKAPRLEALGIDPEPTAEVLEAYAAMGERLRPHVVDGVAVVLDAVRAGERIFLEGAQGSLLDLDLGTYPFVTSSNTNIGGLLTGSGLPPRALGEVIGVAKGYSTRVGSGPFPTELDDATGERLRERGREFGTTTGRPRRCGWFDAVAARFAVAVNGVDALALTKLDVLSGFDELRVAVAYDIGGRRVETYPSSAEELAAATPIWRALPGWREDIGKVRDYSELPRSLRDYVAALEELVEAPVRWASVGPGREDIVERTR